MRYRRKSFTHGWKHSPFAFSRLELEDKVDDFGWPPFRTRGVWGSAAWAPDVDLFVRNHRLTARMDLPGLTKDDVVIEMGDGELTIYGAWPHEADAGHEHGYRCACEYGPFFRTVPLPEGVRFEDVEVTFAHGFLEIAIPMPADLPAPRKVEIEAPAPCS
jgi:HSP20 family protein